MIQKYQGAGDDTALNRIQLLCCQVSEFRCNGTDEGCCTESNPCSEGDGDCDNDDECAGDLICGEGNCPKISPFEDDDDCCIKPQELETTTPSPKTVLTVTTASKPALVRRNTSRGKTSYADSANGHDDIHCGMVDYPCKYLEQAILNAEEKVFIKGDVFVNKTIEIRRKKFSIVGLNAIVHWTDEVNANGRQKESSTRFAFTVFEDETIVIKDVYFRNLGVLMIYRNPKVVVSNCTVSGIVDEIFHIVYGIGVNLVIANSTFQDSGGYVLFFDNMYQYQTVPPTSKITLERCKVSNSKGVFIRTDDSLQVSINNCEFKNITCPMLNVQRGLIKKLDQPPKNPSRTQSILNITDTTFDTSVVPLVSGGHNSSCGAGGAVRTNWLRRVKVHQCKFLNHRSKLGGAIYVRHSNVLELTGSNFTGNKGKSSGGAVYAEKVEVNIVQNSIFRENKALKGGAVSAVDIGKSMTISSSIFHTNYANIGGAISSTDMRKISCKENDEYELGEVKVDGCYMKNNKASVLGQSIFNNNDIIISSLTIECDETMRAYHIQSEGGSFTMRNSSIKIYRSRVFEEVNSGVYVTSSNIDTSEGFLYKCPVNFNVRTSNFSTRSDDQGKGKNKTYNFMEVSCESCTYETYSLDRGSLYLENIQEHPSVEEIKCLPCPTGGRCGAKITARDNFWGYKDFNEEVNFILCPTGYCCSSDTTPCTSYNTCRNGRSGPICGSCGPDKKQSFLSDGCIEKGSDCNFNWFIAYFFLYSVVFTLVFVCLTNLKDILAWVLSLVKSVREKNNQVVADQDGPIGVSNEDEEPVKEDGFSIAAYIQIVTLFFQVASLLQETFQGFNKDPSSKNEEDSSGERYKEVLADIFNFKLTLFQRICPSDELTLPQKEMILFAMKMCTFLILFLLMLLSLIASKSNRSSKMKNLPQKESEATALNPVLQMLGSNTESSDIEKEGRTFERGELEDCMEEGLSLSSRLKFTAIKLLKLYYTPLVVASLQMTHCVEILGVRHLYVHGPTACYTSWQIVIFTVILPGILLFPFSFELALRLLKDRVISSSLFVLSCGCPYFAIFLYVKRLVIEKRRKRESSTTATNDVRVEDEADTAKLDAPLAKKEVDVPLPNAVDEKADGSNNGDIDETLCVQTILQTEEELFKNDESSSFQWQVIQFYRTFLISVITTFIVNPIYRQPAFFVVLVVFVMHDRYRKPYSNSFLNTLQLYSSVCLLLVLGCNTLSAYSYMVKVTQIPGVSSMKEVLAGFEMIVYASVPFTLPLWKIQVKIAEKVELRQSKEQQIQKPKNSD